MNNQSITGPNVIKKGEIIMQESVGKGEYKGDKIIIAHNAFTGALETTYNGRTVVCVCKTFFKAELDAINTVLEEEQNATTNYEN